MSGPDFQQRFVEALHRIVQQIQSAGDLNALLIIILEESKLLCFADASSLFLYDSERNDLFFEAVAGGDEAIRTIRIGLDQGIVGAAATQRETLIVNDCQTDSRHLRVGGFFTRNLIAVPMVRNDRLIGVLEVLNKRGGLDFDSDDARILEITAEQAAAQIENARLIRDKVRAERLAALGTTAAGLAHYIKNVLGQWKGSSQLIDMGIARADLPMLGEVWPLLKRSNDKITKLVQDMLTISKTREPERQTVSLNKMAREILEECGAKAQQASVELREELDDTLPPGDLDPSRIHDVLLNLVGNAIEAIEEAMLPSASVTVRTRYDSRAGRVLIEVEDTGPGMPPEVRARVFEPFYSTKGSRGTGLGLAVASKNIEEHGGRMTLESERGVGTKFSIDLPHEPARELVS